MRSRSPKMLGWIARQWELIKAAEERGFDALVTPDKNIGYQQNLKDGKLAIVILPAGRWSAVQDQLQQVVQAIDEATRGSYYEIPLNRVKSPSLRIVSNLDEA